MMPRAENQREALCQMLGFSSWESSHPGHSTMCWWPAGESQDGEKTLVQASGPIWPLPTTLQRQRQSNSPSIFQSHDSPLLGAQHLLAFTSHDNRRQKTRLQGLASHLSHADIHILQVGHKEDYQVEDLVPQGEDKHSPLDLGQQSPVGLEGCQAQVF